MSMSARLCITMLSDWSIGSGTGRQGSLDSLVARDVTGLPYVPASTLRGMWRDAAETVAHGLDNGAPGGWSALVQNLFGSQPALDAKNGGDSDNQRLQGPVPSLLSVGDARYPDGFGEWLAESGKTRARQAMVFVKPGVAIDPLTGSAKTDFLRFDETARAGAQLYCAFSIHGSGDAKTDHALAALALASLVLLERLGGDRRRGLGACMVSVLPSGAPERPSAGIPATSKEAVAWLVNNPHAPSFRKPADSWPAIQRQAPQTAQFRRFQVRVEILSPTTIAQAVQGNLVSTSHHIPGSQLLHAAGQFAARLGMTQAQIDEAIAAGDLRILPAYPELPDGTRSLPVPLTIEEQKGREGVYRNKLADGVADEQHKPMRGKFCSADPTAGLVIAKPLRTKLHTHNAVHDERQKPTEAAGGGVFVLEAIEPGENMQSELWIRTGPAIAEATFAKLKGASIALELGRAKMAGSGRVSVTIGAELEAAKTPGATKTQLWVVSDIILPDGETRPDAAIKLLFARAGLGDGSLDIKSEIRISRREGWIRSWGVPRQTLTVISAGSVIVLAKPLSDAALAKLAKTGLGGRQAEGYGHVLVNAALLNEKGAALKAVAASKESTGLRAVSSNPIPPDMLKLAGADHIVAIEDSALTALMESYAQKAVADNKARREIFGWYGDKPTMSQLGNLRIAAAASTISALITYAKQVEASGRDKDWGSKDVFKTTMALFGTGEKADEAPVWAALKIPEDELAKCLVRTAPRTVLSDKDTILKAARLLLHAGMRAHKRGLEKAGGSALESAAMET